MDFVPQPTDNTYEGFEDLIDRMNSWLRELRGVQVINIQSVMVQKHDGKLVICAVDFANQISNIICLNIAMLMCVAGGAKNHYNFNKILLVISNLP